jgi:hypothetical protein
VRIGDREVENWGDVVNGAVRGSRGRSTIELVDPGAHGSSSTCPRTRKLGAPSPDPSARGSKQGSAGWRFPAQPADRPVLEPGDRIVAVEGRPVENWWDLVREIESRPGQRVEIALDRDGTAELVRAVTPETSLGGGQRDRRDDPHGRQGRHLSGRILGELAYQRASGWARPSGTATARPWRSTGLILGFLGTS